MASSSSISALLSPPTSALFSSKSKISSLSFNKIQPFFFFKQKPITPSTISAAAANSTFILHELGLSESQIDLLFQTHPQIELSSTESLNRRISQLRSLRITESAISRRPEILTSPEFDPLLDFIQKHLVGEIQQEKLERLLISTNPSNSIERIHLLLERGIPEEKLAHVINSVNVGKVFDGMQIRELEEVLLFLQRFGSPEIILRRPAILNLDLQTQLIPRINFLIDLADGEESAAATLIRKLPGILAYTVSHFRSHLNFWTSIGLTREQILKMALVYPNIFSVSKERKLKPRIEFLTQCSLNTEEIFKFLIKAPTFLSLSFEKNLSKKLGFLIKIGYKHQTKELAIALGSVTRTSCKNLQMVVSLFLSYGFSCEDLLKMSKKHPQILQYNWVSLEKKMEFLIEEMERDVGELMGFPAFLGYKLDDRIKHRYEMKKESRGKGMSLNKLLSVSTKRFNLKME
ncbi:transcription termination factor MTERF8, chloroplastic [Asparagus officinalis]|nr:transcription termination factor MTERF8, chloroplastic [Asparagus officinalis]